jgi:hypothetical protein
MGAFSVKSIYHNQLINQMKLGFMNAFILLNALPAGLWAQSIKTDAVNKNVVQRTIIIDSLKKAESVEDVTQRVVEATYKSYPQQPGQPTIIINNIILPPDHSKQAYPAAPVQPQRTALSGEEDAAFQEWLRHRRSIKEGDEWKRDYSKEAYAEAEPSKNGFQERFKERAPRNSGTWVIPVVGIHASALEADLKNDEVSGRTGWNAGIDLRMRAKRFFVQPGLHYFNSSLDVTSKDSLSEARLIDGPRIHSLKLPVLIGIYLTKANSGFFKFNIKGGATANYLLSVDKSSQTQFGKDNLEEFSYGVNGGIGLEFGLITLDVSHEWGITRFFKDSSKHNNVLRATLGIKI